MIHANDEELIRMLTADPALRGEAFRHLYDRYSSMLLRFVFRFCPAQAQAEEILHDVFLEILKTPLPDFTEGGLKPWLFTIARNKSLNHRRRSSKEISSNDQVDAAVDSRSLEEQLSQEQLLQKMAIGESRLSPELRETWILRRQGFDYQQIATELKIPLGTVKSRFHTLALFFRKEIFNEIE